MTPTCEHGAWYGLQDHLTARCVECGAEFPRPTPWVDLAAQQDTDE